MFLSDRTLYILPYNADGNNSDSSENIVRRIMHIVCKVNTPYFQSKYVCDAVGII